MGINPLLQRQQLTERILQVKEGKQMTWEQIANALYQILDDIDTCDDACKENAESFRSNVMRLQAKKNRYMCSPDGFDLARVNEAKHDRFTRGSGSYKCSVCGKQTRDTGHDEAQTKLCAKCFAEAGEINAHEDGQHEGTPVSQLPLLQTRLCI